MMMRLSDPQQRRGTDGDDATAITIRSSSNKFSSTTTILKWALVVPTTAGLIVFAAMTLFHGTTTPTTTSVLTPSCTTRSSSSSSSSSTATLVRRTTTTGETHGRDLQSVMNCQTDANCPTLYCPQKPCTAFVCRENKCSVTTLTADTAAPQTNIIPTPAPVVVNNNNNNNIANNITNVTMMPKPTPFPTTTTPAPTPTPSPTNATNTGQQQQQEEEEESQEYMFVGNDVCTRAVGPIPITAQGLGDSRSILIHGTTDSLSFSAERQQQQQSYAPSCNGISHSGPGAWYTVIGTGARMTASTCWPGSNYDTAISVYSDNNNNSNDKNNGKRRRYLKKEDDKDKDKDKDKDDEEENNNDEGAGAAGAGGSGVCGSLTCVAANDDASGNFGSCLINSILSRVQWESTRGQKYYLLVHGFHQRVGNFDLNVISARPINERCEDAISIPINGPNIIGTTFQAQLPWGPDKATNCGGRFGLVGDTSSVWYKVRSDRTQTLEASTCNPLTDFDTKLHIFQGSCSSSGSCLGGNDNHNSPNRCSLTTWTAQAGTDYFILVHAFMFDNGLFDLTVRAL